MPSRRTNRARELRRSATDAERYLWYHLRNRSFAGFKFRRQFPIGPYFADFCCHELRLVVEVDGGQHAEHIEQDAGRTAFLQSNGYRVLRFWNSQVFYELDAVLESIRLELQRRDV